MTSWYPWIDDARPLIDPWEGLHLCWVWSVSNFTYLAKCGIILDLIRKNAVVEGRYEVGLDYHPEL